MPLDHRQRAFADGAEADHDDGAGNLRIDLRGGAHGMVSPESAGGQMVRGGSGGTTPGGYFDLNFHLGLEQARDDQQRRGRADLAENLAADREMGVRVV